MSQAQEGLFVIEEQMPCSPQDISIYHYALPNTLDRAEQEEAAARILSFSQQLDRWVGVSWPLLIKMMKKDLEESERINAIQQHNFKEQERVQRTTRWHYVLCIITFGIYAIFASKPMAQMKETSKKKLPFSGIFLFGPDHVITGIHELLKKKMLRRVTMGKFDVLFPTPTLISQIMKTQGVTVNS